MSDPIDELLTAQERIIWQDRSDGPGSRRFRSRVRYSAKDFWLPILLFSGAFLFLLYDLATGPTDGLVNRIALPLGTLGVVLLIWNVREQERRYFRRAELDYILTDQRLIMHNRTDGFTLQVMPGGLAGLKRHGNNIDVHMKHPDDAHSMVDLKDAAAAERAIAETLGPIS